MPFVRAFIAYVNHDIDDAIRAGVLREEDLPASTHDVLGPDHSSRIQTLVVDTVRTSAELDEVRMSPGVWDAMMELRSFLFDKVYYSEAVLEQTEKARRLVESLFFYYVDHVAEVPEEAMMELRSFLFDKVYYSEAVLEQTEKARRLVESLFFYYVDHVAEVPEEYRVISDGDDVRAVVDYLAGMTDRSSRRVAVFLLR